MARSYNSMAFLCQVISCAETEPFEVGTVDTILISSSLYILLCLPFQSQGHTVLHCFLEIAWLFVNPCGKTVQQN